MPDNKDAEYWERLAPNYDYLFLHRLAAWEDMRTWTALQAVVRNRPKLRVLDVGCGTGLALRLLTGNEPASVDYTGLDRSTSMIDQLRTHHPAAHTILGLAEDVLPTLPSESFDVVISINAAASYIADQSTFLREVARLITRDRGQFMLSYLNRTSLRRLVHWRRGQYELYTTRGDRRRSVGVLARLMTKAEFAGLAQNAGLKVNECEFGSVLGGVAEWSWILPFEKWLETYFPSRGHTIVITGERVR